MKKLMISMLAALCMLGFTACGNADSSNSAPADTAVQTESVQPETQAQEKEQPEQSAEVTESEQSISGIRSGGAMHRE